ncbi:MAG: hypothetical protein FD181_2995 [Prolixibacteraceae bacterium]|nr:MAG: hypothetical protein FD181_2995 [Prolixibacteraceae bacterium]
MTDFRKACGCDKIPEPYYGRKEGFELVLDLLKVRARGNWRILFTQNDTEK